MDSVFYLETAVGTMGICDNGSAITQIFFGRIPSGEMAEQKTPLNNAAAIELEEYFAGRRQCFDLPLAPKGTVFQQQVWRELGNIPYGETRSYLDIAVALDNPKACRAIGMANNKNPLAIVVPCHRVIGADGSLTGYAAGVATKEYLLQLERNK